MPKTIDDVNQQRSASDRTNIHKDARSASSRGGLSAALELLRQNSREAATVVRTFTDQELGNSAPLGLSFGAPMTAQFVVEDHAMRHSWHYLATIRKALGR